MSKLIWILPVLLLLAGGCGNDETSLELVTTPELSPGEEMDLAALPYADWRPTSLCWGHYPGSPFFEDQRDGCHFYGRAIDWVTLWWTRTVPYPEWTGNVRYTIDMKPGIDPADNGWVTVVDHQVIWATGWPVFIFGLQPDTWYMFRMNMTIYDQRQSSQHPPAGEVLADLKALHPRIERYQTQCDFYEYPFCWRDNGIEPLPRFEDWAITEEGVAALSDPDVIVVDVSQILANRHEGLIE